MPKTMTVVTLGLVVSALVISAPILAQSPPAPPPRATPHHAHQAAASPSGGPTLPGQDAFGAIAEIVRLLEADPTTDWSTVDLERLRQHLIDMHEVVLRSEVRTNPIPGGLVMDVTGVGRTEQAIRAMIARHAAELDHMPEWLARAEEIPDGVRLTVTARRPEDARTVARIRGLGFAGLLVQGGHHGPHHLAIAKGESGLVTCTDEQARRARPTREPGASAGQFRDHPNCSFSLGPALVEAWHCPCSFSPA